MEGEIQAEIYFNCKVCTSQTLRLNITPKWVVIQSEKRNPQTFKNCPLPTEQVWWNFWNTCSHTVLWFQKFLDLSAELAATRKTLVTKSSSSSWSSSWPSFSSEHHFCYFWNLQSQKWSENAQDKSPMLLAHSYSASVNQALELWAFKGKYYLNVDFVDSVPASNWYFLSLNKAPLPSHLGGSRVCLLFAPSFSLPTSTSRPRPALGVLLELKLKPGNFH